MSTQFISVIKSSVLFKDISDAELSKLASQCVMKSLSPGESLFFEKEESKALYIVATGTISIKKSSSAGDESVTHLGGHSHLGEMALLMKVDERYERRSATAEASEMSLVLEIPYDALTHFFNSSPAVGLAFYRNLAVSLAGRIRRTTEDLAGVRALRLRHT
jgi:CRP-like cAMP-binding protein